MAGVNKVMVLGNLGRDPEVRYSNSGMAICNLSVAVTERVKSGETWKDETEWFRVVVFGKTAENAAQYLAKGRQVFVEGRLRTTKYQDKQGIERTATEVVASSLTFVGGGKQPEGDLISRPASAPKPQKAGAWPKRDPEPLITEDDLPF